MESFMKWLNRELDRIGWSDSELARRCGVTPAAIFRITKDGRQPSAKLARAIAAAFAPFTGMTQREVFVRAGLIDRDVIDDVDPRVLSKFSESWKGMTPDLQKRTEEEFTRMSSDEFAVWLMGMVAPAPSDDAIVSEGDKNEPGGAPTQPAPVKGGKRQQARLQRRGGSA